MKNRIRSLVMVAACVLVIVVYWAISGHGEPENEVVLRIPADRGNVAVSSTEVVAVTDAEAPLRIDLNTAGVDELSKLHGIGEAKAAEIVRYREEHGLFYAIEELMNVSGIGEGIFENIRDFIYVDASQLPVRTEPPAPTSEPPVHTEHKVTLEDVAPIDLNSADLDTLMLLPHVDEEIAVKIVEMREHKGGFDHVYELLLIDELSRDEVAEIIEFVYVEKEDEP